ncbi:MAG: multifunctional CCA addition/repair protein [Enterobacterales bacterium]
MKKYLVGGAIRDYLLNLPVKEKDWIVVESTVNEMINKGFKKVGKDFPVFLHPKNKEEYALARTEKKIRKGYTGFICNISKNISLEEDLYRRDLTINAIACDKYGNIIDPYNGQKDIKYKKLRHISNAFKEDPLRVLRVARFAARFFHLNFSVAPKTINLMKQMIKELKYISPERIWKETELALSTKNPHIYFKILKECNALKVLFPEINFLFKKPKITKCHAKTNFGIHTFMALFVISKLSTDIKLRFCVLFHYINNYSIFNKNKYQLRFENFNNFCKRLKIPNTLQILTKTILKNYDSFIFAKYLTSKKIIELFDSINIWRYPERLNEFTYICYAESVGCKKCEYNVYIQSKFLFKAFNIAKLVTTLSIISEGFTGSQISKNLKLRRQNILDKFLINYYKK